MSNSDRKPTHTLEEGVFNASQVRLYGLYNEGGVFIRGGRITFQESQKESGHQGNFRSIGVIYGYAYEGHCYDLPKPAIMLLPVTPETEMPNDDCGYNEKPEYRVWVVDKLEDCTLLEVSNGNVEQLVLDANKPGRRSPSTYRATMQVAHRSSGLTD